MGKQRMPHTGTESGGCLCRKILRRDRTYQPDQTKCDQNQTHLYNIRSVLIGNSHVNNRRHDKRDKELKRRFQHLKERSQDSFLLIVFQINK